MKLTYTFATTTRGDFAFLDIPAFPEIVVRIDETASRDHELYSLAERSVRHALQARLSYGDIIPKDQKPKEKKEWHEVRMTPLVIMKVLLHQECRARNWSKADLARNLDITPTTAARLLDLFHESRSEVVTYAFHRLGKAVHATIDLVQVDL